MTSERHPLLKIRRPQTITETGQPPHILIWSGSLELEHYKKAHTWNAPTVASVWPEHCTVMHKDKKKGYLASSLELLSLSESVQHESIPFVLHGLQCGWDGCCTWRLRLHYRRSWSHVNFVNMKWTSLYLSTLFNLINAHTKLVWKISLITNNFKQ